MFKELFSLFRSAVLLHREVHDNARDIAELRLHLDKVTDDLQSLAAQLRYERHEREKLALRLENVLLRFERRLPSPGKSSAES